MLRLELEDRALDFDEPGGLFHITEVDWGYPEVRAKSEVNTLRRGVRDLSALTGARVISISGYLAIDWREQPRSYLSQDAALDALAPFLRVAARPYLIREHAGEEQRIQVRSDQQACAQIAANRDFSLSLTSPTGVFEGPLHEWEIYPEVAERGIPFNWTLPLSWPDTEIGTYRVVTNGGSELADWTAKIYGPCFRPQVQNLSTGQAVSLARTSSWIPDGQYIEVSSADHTVLADSLPENSRWGTVDFERTDWWQLPAGPNRVRFRVEDWSPPAHMLFSWRDTYLL